MQRAVPLLFRGKPPKPPKSVIVNRYPLLSLRSGGELTFTTYPLLYGSQSQGAFGGSPPTDYPQWVACGQPPSQREGGSVWQIFTLERLKVTLGISPRKPPTHRSVGRYRQGIIGYNCPCVSYGITHRHKTAHTAPTSLC